MSAVVGLIRPVVATPSRDAALDIARGIAMVLVVYGHALDGAQSAGHASYALRFMLILVYTVHVPLFFQASGILSRSMCIKPWPEFLIGLGTRIIWPYLLWAFILLTVHYVMGGYTNGTLQRYQPLSILWHAPAVLWFLYVLCIGMVLLRVLATLPWYVTLGIGFLCLLAPYVSADWPQKSRFIGMFLIGAVGGPAMLRVALHPICVALAAAVMGITIVLAAQMAQVPIIGYPSYHAMFIPAIFAGPLLFYAASSWMAQIGPNTLLKSIGRNTMAIFVTHILITAGMRIVLRQLGVTEWWLIILLATIAGVLIPLAVAYFVKRRGLSRILGWQ